jgi:hypothetical protein
LEIEYQNKYVVTWCLDRDGPRICFRAVTKENQLRTIEIFSEDFILELEDEEARDFLNILSQLAAAGSIKQVKQDPVYKASAIEGEHSLKVEDDAFLGFVPDVVESTVSEAVPDVVESTVPEAVPDVVESMVLEAVPDVVESTVSEAVPDVVESTVPEAVPDVVESKVPEAVPDVVVPEISETTTTEVSEVLSPDGLDTSEIIQILKKSEETYSEITPSSLDGVSIEDQTPIPPQSETKKIREKSIVSELSSLDFSPTEIETASFFQKSEPKSPLEMLFEEDKEKEETEGTIDSSQVSEPEETFKSTPETKISYTPDDLQTDTFFSKFDTKAIVDIMQKPKPEPKPESELTPKPEPKPEFKRAVNLSPAPKIGIKEPISTDAERRAAIEKERAERRKRLWELTRGF